MATGNPKSERREGKEYRVKETAGKVIERRNRGMDCPAIVTVQYSVNGEVFTIKESLKIKSQAIKTGFLPIGQRKTFKLNCQAGDTVTVIYDERKPHKRRIKGNEGIINC
ncbi:MAG: hypothetical protein QM270_04080 [Bacillota bacterium]|nr:hypothetical protein [Bacillota bacterium]